MNYKLHYLASPYSHQEAEKRLERFNLVGEAVVRFLHLGVYVFSPIAYNAPMEKHNLPTDWNFWQNYDKAFIERCDSVIVFAIEGHEKSVGVAAEIEFAKSLNLPIFYVTLDDVEDAESFATWCKESGFTF